MTLFREQEENKQEHAVHAHTPGGHCPPGVWPCFHHVLYMFFCVLLVLSLNTCLGHWRTIQYKRHVPHMYHVIQIYSTYRTCKVHLENKQILILCVFLIIKLFLLTASLNNIHEDIRNKPSSWTVVAFLPSLGMPLGIPALAYLCTILYCMCICLVFIMFCACYVCKKSYTSSRYLIIVQVQYILVHDSHVAVEFQFGILYYTYCWHLVLCLYFL